MSHDAVELLRSLIKNACVNDGTPESGHEHRSVVTLMEFFGVEGEIFEVVKGRQSLVYRISGSDPNHPSLALVPHLDVVPADPHGWSVDPFAAEVIDGFVYGRGAVDMLNVTAAMAAAARPYIRGELQPRGDLVFAAVADEEAGGSLGARALVETRWDLVRADYLLTEVAYPPPKDVTRPVVPVSTGEKGVFWRILRSMGTPGHGSAPYSADNAVEKLVRSLIGLFDTPSPVSIDELWETFVGALDLDVALVEALTDPERVDAAIEELAAHDPLLARYAHAATHLTISPNKISGGVKTNIIADRAEASVDIRALPGMDGGLVDSYLTKAMGSARDDIEVEPVADTEATTSPVGNRLWEAIADSVEDIEGHRNLVPTLMTVATDARFWRPRGTIAYGVGLFDDRMSFSQMLGLFHGHDERVSVGSVERTTALYQRLLDRFYSP